MVFQIFIRLLFQLVSKWWKRTIVYVKQLGKSLLILFVYVDDILLAGNDMKMIVTTKMWLSSIFEMKDMGEANYVLGVKILRDCSKKLLGFSQKTYIKMILKWFYMHNSKPIDTPIEKGHTLSLEDCPKLEKEKREMARVPYLQLEVWCMLCCVLNQTFVLQLVWLVVIKVIQDLFIAKQ